jgi:hypothetical protein
MTQTESIVQNVKAASDRQWEALPEPTQGWNTFGCDFCFDAYGQRKDVRVKVYLTQYRICRDCFFVTRGK